jgi:hypothetical protein
MALFIADPDGVDIWRSDDGGADFSALTREPDDAITCWLVIDDENVITGDADGDIWVTTRYGRRTWDEYDCSTTDISDLAMSPNYASDSTLIAGDDASQVWISFDGGEEWDEVSDDDIADTTTNDGNTYVTFDPRYADNMLIYAASDDTIASCEVDPDEDAGDLEFTILSEDDLTTANGTAGIVCTDDGMQVGEHVATLYVAGVTGDEGVWRCLNPDEGTDAVFEQADMGLAGIAGGQTFDNQIVLDRNLHSSYGSNILYAIDSTGDLVYTYEDTLAAPVVLVAPTDGTGIDSTDTISFEWEDLNADTVNLYQIQLNEEDGFPTATNIAIGDLEVDGDDATDEYVDDNEVTYRDADAGTEYYWRVRVGEQVAGEDDEGPLLSRWSEIRMFTTRVQQVAEPIDVAPAPGAQDVVLMPAFSWGAVDGADFYEIEVATDADFTNIVDSGTPAGNVYLASTTLEYGTTYYWRVRGIAFSGAPEGDWNVSVFTTMLEPTEEAPPVVVEEAPAVPDVVVEVPAPVEAIPSWMLIVIIAIGAVLVVALIVLIVRTRRTV